ncbi:hypothetical protein FOZ63_031565 [Perkinsus olseni]|uniref:Uncharacterized protein n=2 Tax=Perkinsus olseni TaxID=32597 RepID=A0A7J6SU11_PEROL|nr:hypothetical protein FOZ63_031565 [Perkinsus olseni]
MVASVNLFAFLNLAILVWEDCIIEWCVSRWKVELRGLDLGPAPSWLDDPPSDFDHLPPGADEYANFSLDLSIKNNPKWLHVEILDLQVGFHGGTLVILFPSNVTLSRTSDVSITKRVRFDNFNELLYLCLNHVSWGEGPLITIIYFEAKFSFLGRTSRAVPMTTQVPFYGVKGVNRASRLSVTGRRIAQGCAELYDERRQAERSLAVSEYGKVVICDETSFWNTIVPLGA